ncbi:uncharacterized protein AMSG_00001, partial [Thecamonas trahens ATCC 50062]
ALALVVDAPISAQLDVHDFAAAFVAAAAANRLAVVDYLLATPSDLAVNGCLLAASAALGDAASGGHDAIVTSLLDNMTLAPLDIASALRRAAAAGHAAIVASLLAADSSRSKPTRLTLSHAFVDACSAGHVAVVRLLLLQPELELAELAAQALALAVRGDHIATVAALLADRRIDASANNNEALTLAHAFGHLSIEDMLAADPRVMASIHPPSPLLAAALAMCSLL